MSKMELKSLTISPKRSYLAVGEDNPYVGKISISYHETSMEIPIPPEMVVPILQLTESILKEAAAKAVTAFVTSAVAQTIAAPVEAAAIALDKEEGNRYA